MSEGPLVILITGVSGAGKTAIAGQLGAFGYDATSLDGHEGLCDWTGHNGRTVSRPDAPDLRWLAQHHWRWDEAVLTELVARKRATDTDLVWLAGVAANTIDLAHLFDLRILLRIDRATMRQRVANPQRSNDFGRAGASARVLEQRFAADQERLAAACDTSVDATAPLTGVSHELLIAAGFAMLRHHATGHTIGDGRTP